MTGFGKSQTITKNFELEIEVRSVNSRYLDLSIRIPSTLSVFEMPIRDKVKEKVIRGKVAVYASIKKTFPMNREASSIIPKFWIDTINLKT